MRRLAALALALGSLLGSSALFAAAGWGASYGLVTSSPPSIIVPLDAPAVGTPLTGLAGAFVRADGGPSFYNTSWQWFDCDRSSATCAPIAGATGKTYIVQQSDIGHTIKLEQIATSETNGTGEAWSDPTPIVPGAPVEAAPLWKASPTVTGRAAVGQTLTVAGGSVGGHPSPKVVYSWQRSKDGSSWTPIGSPTAGATYTVPLSAAGYRLRAVATATNGAGEAAVATAPTAIVPVTDWVLYQRRWPTLRYTYASPRFPAAWSLVGRLAHVASPTVALVDTGTVRIPDLQGRLSGFDFVGNGAGWYDDQAGHGTIDAGEIAAGGTDGSPLVGACWSCRLLSLRVADGDAGASPRAPLLAPAIRYAVDHGARVLNLSLECRRHRGTQCAPAIRAVARAIAHGVLVVVAAGNDSSQKSSNVLTDVPGVLVVGGFIADGSRGYTGSDYGRSVDVAAPGCAPISPLVGGRAGTEFPQLAGDCGTSQAAPLVSGLAGLVLSVDPGLTARQVARIIESTSRPVAWVRYGRIDAAAAVRRAIALRNRTSG